MIWGKEIEVLQALASTPPAIRSEEDLQSLVHEITSTVEEAQPTESREKKLDIDSDVSELAGSIQARPQQSEFNAESDGEPDSRFPSPKPVDSPWKVGAHVSARGGMENAVTNAVSIGSVIHIWSCY